MNNIKKNDLKIKSCYYNNKTFYIKIEEFDKLSKAPIKVINHKTNNERQFTFFSESDNNKIFKCDNLLLIITKF